MSALFVHPREVLLGGIDAVGALPVCDHYCGEQAKMLKSLALQSEMTKEFARCVFDVTLDCEDGAPVGGERDHAQMVAELARTAHSVGGASKAQASARARVAVRIHPVDHPAFYQDVELLFGSDRHEGHGFCHVMLPKVERVEDVEVLCKALAQVGEHSIPIHCLIESPAAVYQALPIAAHARVESLSFGLMDYVSSHGGAIGQSAMGYPGQFTHPLVVRAKLEIASACHAKGKVPSHCVVTEYRDIQRLTHAAKTAASDLGYTRMWSIHPSQIRPILAAFSPDESEVDLAAQVIQAAMNANWGPVSVNQVLHDRASFRYFWSVLQRAHGVGQTIEPSLMALFAH